MGNWLQSTPMHRHKWHLRRGRKPGPGNPTGGGMTMSAVDRTTAADLGLLSPTMRVAVIEDLCWAMSRAGWLARRPRWWRRTALRAWRAEEAVLDNKRGRVAELVSQAGKE